MKVSGIRSTWSLWECLPSESLVELIQYQWDKYGQKLDILATPKSDIQLDTSLESPDEIDRLMRQKPRSPKGDD